MSLQMQGSDLDGGWGVCIRVNRPSRSRRIEDYRDARYAAEQALETATLGYTSETAEYNSIGDRFGRPMPTLRTWLRATRGENA